MTRLLTLAVVARLMRDPAYSPHYLRRIAADQGRSEDKRRYSASTHEKFPPFIKQGNVYYCPEVIFHQFMDRRLSGYMQTV